jgi:protein TonB
VAHGASSIVQNPHATLWGVLVAVSLHTLAGLGIALVPKRGLQDRSARPVEVDLRAPKPPESLPPTPDPPPPLPDLTPKPLMPKLARKQAVKLPPPIPNQEVPPTAPTEDPVKPVFGVTQAAVVPGESPVAVPVGNTLMTKDRTLAKVAPLPLPPALPPVFAPVDEESVAELPEKIAMPDLTYPELARRLGVEGKVRLRIGIDRRGNVKSVRILQKAGYGMDEEAERKIWQSKWKPAKREDGQTVDVVIHYNVIFRSPTY